MVNRVRLRVNVANGDFPEEKVVSFTDGERKYTLFVDERDVNDNTIDVAIVAEKDGWYLVDLPSDTFTSGPRVWVPSDLLELSHQTKAA